MPNKSLAELQKEIKEFCLDHGLESPAEHRCLDAVSEIGEVAKEILKMSDYGRRAPKFREEIRGEMGDAMYSLITLANSYDIDLGNEIELVLNKYRRRLTKGSAGSENE